jgi:serine/threonine-protein kinase
LLAALSAGGIFFWKRRTARTIAEIERRAVVAESGTGIPKKIAGYQIVKLIGEGGMAHVYQGQDSHGRDFAIKIPKTVDERFQRECIIATTLDSPHIVKAFEFYAEKAEGKPAFMAQEMLLGQTLQDRLEGSDGLPLDEVDRWTLQLLDGLEAAHAQGILHRDLKPENLFLDRATGKETLKILDFGVARADDALLVTVSGAMLGTPIYSSPEQNRSDKLDHRSDLYSVGLILYEMLTGQRTWSALNRYELLKLHNAGLKTPVVELRPDVPVAWNALVSDLLRTNPAERPATVAQVRQRWIDGRP